jgi:Flp pilus assembly pilin Flp
VQPVGGPDSAGAQLTGGKALLVGQTCRELQCATVQRDQRQFVAERVVHVLCDPGPLAQPGLLGDVALVPLWTVLGAALAQLFRSVPAALTVILVVPLITEQLIASLSYVPVLHWLGPAVKFLPFTAGERLLYTGGEVYGEYFGRWVSGGVLATFVAVVLAAAWTLFTHRDA